MFRVFSAMSTFGLSVFNNCKTHQFLYDITAYCFDSKMCDSMGSLIMNFASNLLVIFINMCQFFLTLGVYWWPMDLKTLWKKYRDWGVTFGYFILCLIDYQQTRDMRPSWADLEKNEQIYEEEVKNH